MRNVVISSLLAALLLSLGWLSCGGVALLAAFVPLLYINEQLTRGRGWRCFLWTGLALGLWCGVATWWIWYAAPIGAIMAVAIEAIYFGGMMMLYRMATLRAPRWLACGLLTTGWIFCEWLYTAGELSFPWLTLGNGFANDPWLVQWYEYTGTLGGSLWILLSGVFIWEALRRRSMGWGFGAMAVVLVPAAISVAIYLGYREPEGRRVRVTVVQPNIDPYGEKFSRPQNWQTELMTSLIRGNIDGQDYIVLPETAIDEDLWEGRLDGSASLAELRQLLRDTLPEAQIIVGATTFRNYGAGGHISETARKGACEMYWYDVYNSSLAVDTAGVEAIHHKAKLVAGAEKIPFWSLTKRLDFLVVDLGGISGQLGSDTLHTVFVSPRGVRSVAPICYESVYGEYVAEFVRRGAQIIFIITNDGWWHDTAGHRQHFSFARLRAVETRCPIARSANTGISGFITPRGDVGDRLGWAQRGALTADLTTGSHLTFYTRHGDYIGRICGWAFIALLLGTAGYGIYGRKRRI